MAYGYCSKCKYMYALRQEIWADHSRQWLNIVGNLITSLFLSDLEEFFCHRKTYKTIICLYIQHFECIRFAVDVKNNMHGEQKI